MNREKSKWCANVVCTREPLESSKDGYCIFHAKAEEKKEKEFREALRDYINEIEAKDSDHNFESFVFVGDIDFELEKDFKVTVFKNANFILAEFQGYARFSGREFEGGAGFWNTEFQGTAYFDNAEFRGGAHFSRTKFQGAADFGYAEFHSLASFLGASLENISLTPLNLKKDAFIYFAGARLRNTEMKREDIEGHIMEELARMFSGGEEVYLLLKNNFHSLGRYDDESWAFRKEKEMERKSFWHFRKEHKTRDLGENWKDKGLRDYFKPGLSKCKHVAKCIQDQWFPISWKKMTGWLFPYVYIASLFQDPHPVATIKNEFKDFLSSVKSNRGKETGEVNRKELPKVLWFYIKYPAKYFGSTILKYLYGWGEQPWLIFLWCGLTIFLFSLLYLRVDITTVDITTKNTVLVNSYLDKLYFSGITFTALGYGGYLPVGVARFLAFLESFLGIFFIALFVFSFARRTAGR